jgi:CheY-like chemotaxis protein
MSEHRFSMDPEGTEGVSLPWWKRWVKPGPKQPSLEEIVKEPAVASNGKKVLIVDDDAIILKTTGMKLASQGYTVITARDASEAIRAARHDQPDLILMDLSFPSEVGSVAWDGFLLMSWLHRLQESRSTPVIVITGESTPSQKERAHNFGAIAFFRKPIDHIELVDVINRRLLVSGNEKAGFSV